MHSLHGHGKVEVGIIVYIAAAGAGTAPGVLIQKPAPGFCNRNIEKIPGDGVVAATYPEPGDATELQARQGSMQACSGAVRHVSIARGIPYRAEFWKVLGVFVKVVPGAFDAEPWNGEQDIALGLVCDSPGEIKVSARTN